MTYIILIKEHPLQAAREKDVLQNPMLKEIDIDCANW